MYNDAMKERKEQTRVSAMDRALTYLGYRMRSKKEMEDYLRQKGYEAGEIQETMDRLADYGYIDDVAFSREFLRSRLNRGPVGRKKLEYDLLKKGVDREAIARVLEEYHGQEEEERCRELAERLAAQKGRNRKALQSVQRTLLARGFGYDLIRQALAGLGEEGERD
ncbi:regulatory protein RecX [Christensenella sp. MSJ-20]|uniref:regulatory protein RecX n=1 Tax=Christensenella sp. MSJ-20 TaxID=2841518 RepID=UPI0037BEA240